MQKPLREFIPYVGFGFGYADSRTVLNLTDLSGDLSGQDAMQDFGEDNGGAALDFYTSKTSTNNVALLGAVGFSYGIADNVFIDGGIRLSWIPKIQWALNNELADSPLGVRSKDIFSAHNVIYGAATIGVRFEF
jgi:opacity protein-like surface antigen